MMTYHAQFLLLVVAGWVNRQQQDVIDYLQEENRVLRTGLRGKRTPRISENSFAFSPGFSWRFASLRRPLSSSCSGPIFELLGIEPTAEVAMVVFFSPSVFC